MSTPTELPKTYRPADHENRIRERWESSKAFSADPARVLRGEARPYCIVIPPPNVTAQLHLGHALNNTLQDVLARVHRMKGFETLWMPGTDHAGIATQAVVEKRVSKEEKKRRTDFTREQFVAKIQAFKDEYEAIITDQLKRMGCSCDWDRQRFTMDPVCARAVREAFFILFRDGLIYRGKRLVNWDPALQTAVADDECYDEDVDTSFWYLKYPLTEPVKLPSGETIDHVTVATTRPETYLADTAVAMNPRDPRAAGLVGKKVKLPIVGRIIPIVADDYVVLPKAMARNEEEASDPKAEFATGFLKVTPAHDPNDYDLYQRHKAVIDANSAGNGLINMMSPDGRVSDKHGWSDLGEAGVFVGQKMAEARKTIVKEFEARGLLEATRPYKHSVKHSDRSKAVIEPYLSDQWYVKVTDERMAPSANRALVDDQSTSPTRKRGAGPGSSQATSDAGRTPLASASGSSASCPSGDGSMRFYPARYAKTFEQWHDGIRDWCISRQLWWGHRIPVWHARLRVPNQAGYHGESYWFSELDSVLDGDARQRVAVRIVHTSTGKELDPFKLKLTEDMDAGSPEHVFDVYVCAREDSLVAQLEMDEGFERDSDVLDTWFSSGLWPISTMGWPDPAAAAKDTGIKDFPDLLKAFNPTSTLCTAREIITLWVSRMTMFNRYFMPAGWEAKTKAGPLANARGSLGEGHGPVPFRDVYIHAVVQDGEGRKMSKSLNNGVDPLDIIATHGSDAMRFTLCQMATSTQDVRLPVKKDSATGKNTSEKFDAGRNFCNKLWNAARFAASMVGEGSGGAAGGQRSIVDRWMLSRLARALGEVDASLAQYEYAAYAQTMYDILWRDFCDWYLEAIKPTVAADAGQRAVLRATLDAIVRMLHPIAPYVTEAIFEKLSEMPAANIDGLQLGPSRKGGLLCTAGWPIAAASLVDEKAEAEFGRVQALITAVREIRAQHNVQPKRKITLHLPANAAAWAKGHSVLIEQLAGVGKMEPPAAGGVSFSFEGAECSVSDLADAVDAGAESARLTKQIGDLERSIATLSGRLSNPGYTDRAPAAMVQQTKDQLAKAQAELEAAKGALAKVGG